MVILNLRNLFVPLLALIPLLFLSCTFAPEGITPVSGFEVDRYLGTWYEIARFDHRFERGLTDVTATYALREDGGVEVINRGYDTEESEWKEARGKAFFTGDPSVGQLKVTFFWPFYGGYNIIELDREDYGWALVCGPKMTYLWILARTPSLDGNILNRLIARARELGFDTDRLLYVSHEQDTL